MRERAVLITTSILTGISLQSSYQAWGIWQDHNRYDYLSIREAHAQLWFLLCANNDDDDCRYRYILFVDTTTRPQVR